MTEIQEPKATANQAASVNPERPIYTRNNPYISTVVTNRLLSGEGSEKETRHFAFSLDPNMIYTPGDAVGIVPENRPEAVAEVLEALGFSGDERVLDNNKVEIRFDEALSSWLTISKLARGSVGQYAKLPAAPNVGGRGYAALLALCGPDNKQPADEYCWGREFIDLITDFPGAVTSPQQLFHVLPRLVPRLYSIASSQSVHPRSVETTVRVVRYEAHGRTRQGVASGQLAERADVGSTLPIFLHVSHSFRLPEDDSAPMIMVGPGTGIAPFRAFLEERRARSTSGRNWLFFGDQHSASDFLYEDLWTEMLADGTLTRLDTAFSRDQAEKIYVQTRIRQHAAELYDWLQQGAYFYVCGDAARMAKDVESALLDVIASGAHCSAEQAAERLAELKVQKRYRRDVY